MLKRYGLLVLSVFLVACMPHEHKILPIENTAPSMTQYRQLPAFTQIDVQGHINVHLHTDYKKPSILLKGDPRDLAQVKTVVNGTTLYLIIGKGYPRYSVVSADIRGPLLNRFSYEGSGLITGSQLHTRFLELYLANQGTTQLGGAIGLQKLEVVGKGLTQISGITSHDLRVRLKGKPKVQLTGFVSLSNLDIDGEGWISLYWIKSYHLTVVAKKSAKIQLAGIVNRLEVELWGESRFKGRYLRAQRSFVKTYNHSVAEISAVNHQSTLATDASDIYYYNIPNTRADFMAFNGSVLNMREWSLFELEEFTRYNKQFP